MKFYGANAQVDARREMSLLSPSGTALYKRTQGAGDPDTPEIDTGRSALFTPARLPASALPGAGGAGPYTEDDPPTPEEVAEAANLKYGAIQC